MRFATFRLLASLAIVTGLCGGIPMDMNHKVFLNQHFPPPGALPTGSHIPLVPYYPPAIPVDAKAWGERSPFPGPAWATPYYYAYPPYMIYNSGIGGLVPTYPYPIVYDSTIWPTYANYPGWYEAGR